MVHPRLLSLLLVTLAALCEAQQMGEPPARWHPPPVVSFLQQWGVAPGPRPPGLEAGVRPPWYHQAEDTAEVLSLSRRSQRRTPRQLLPQAPGRRCQLGTCQTHHLFSWLYHISSSDRKDGSQKDMADPMGYGRRRRGT